MKTFKESSRAGISAAIMAMVVLSAVGCGGLGHRLTPSERELVMSSDGLMRVLLVTSREDSLLLLKHCTDLTAKDLQSEVYDRLARRMVATVTDSTQDGVGLAAPQVGLNRRVVAVMRFDKPGYPFEVYPNIYIEYYSEETQTGPEGCLSIPGPAGEVERSQQIIIRYTDPATLSAVRDTVDGYTAVIFQHEVDHLEGILFTDRLTDSKE